jgi:hypothetical protein
MCWTVDRPSLTERTRVYFGFQSASPRRKPSVARLIMSFLVVVAVVVGPLASGYPNAVFIIVLGAVLGAGTAINRRRRRANPAEQPQDWRMDESGNWRWWDGFAWTDAPPGETPARLDQKSSGSRLAVYAARPAFMGAEASTLLCSNSATDSARVMRLDLAVRLVVPSARPTRPSSETRIGPGPVNICKSSPVSTCFRVS